MQQLHASKKRESGFARWRAKLRRRKRDSIKAIESMLHLENEYPITTNTENKFIVSSMITHVAGDNRPHANIKIFGDSFVGLLDSGANVSVLGRGSELLIEKWNLKLHAKQATLKTADGTKIRIAHTIIAPVEYNMKRKYVHFLIAPAINKAVILGMNFWEAFAISPIVNTLTHDEAMNMTLKSNLSEEQQIKLARTLQKFEFTSKDNPRLGCTKIMKHVIDVGSAKPFKQKQYVHSPVVQLKINEEIDRLLDLGVIERAPCPKWLNPIIPVQKSNGATRIVLDARMLNACTVKNQYNSHNASRIIARLRGSKYLSTLDLSDAYYHLEIDEDSRDYTSFAVSTKGTFRYRRMANGLTNASATLCECIDQIMGCDLEPFVSQFMDDFLIMTDDFEHHIELISTVLERLNKAGFLVNIEKSQFCRSQIKFLGLHISENGIEADKSKIQSILDYPAPNTLKRARRLIGMIVWHDKFVKHFSTLLAPITDTLKNQNSPYKWTAQADEAFNQIKIALINAPMLALPDYTLPFAVHCDASNVGVGAMLTQTQNGVEKVIAYFSAKLTPTQQRYFTTEKECLAVILALENFKKYFDGTHVVVYTDHASLLWLTRFKESNGRLVRWALRLQEYDITIKHKKGCQMQVPDALSRMHETDTIDCDSFDSSADKIYNDLVETAIAEPHNKEYLFENDTLYKQIKTKNGDLSYRIYIPSDRIRIALEECHDLPTAAHGGIHKTLYRLREHYFWPNMEADTREYVRNCEVCLAVKQANYNLSIS